MRAIRFLIDCPGSGADGRAFSQGSAHLLKDDSAWHWVRRDKAEYIEHVATASAEPDPVATTDGDVPKIEAVVDPVKVEEAKQTKAEATIARIDELLANPPSVMAPLIPQIEKAENTDGNAVGSAAAVVEKQDGPGASVGTKPAVVSPINPPSVGRSPSRSGRN